MGRGGIEVSLGGSELRSTEDFGSHLIGEPTPLKGGRKGPSWIRELNYDRKTWTSRPLFLSEGTRVSRLCFSP